MGVYAVGHDVIALADLRGLLPSKPKKEPAQEREEEVGEDRDRQRERERDIYIYIYLE